MKKLTVLFAGGGTAGHIAPLLAVMESVVVLANEQGREVACHYVGLQSDVDSPLVQESSLDFAKHAIPAGKIHRYFTAKSISEFGKGIGGFVAADRLIRKIKPDVVCAKGGFVSVPVAFAAARRGIPVIAHETDVVPGMANRIVARFAKKICTAFPKEAYGVLPEAKLIEVGQPVREIFYTGSRGDVEVGGRSVRREIPLVVIIGGSQGAHRLNELIRGAWEIVLPCAQIFHISGPRDHAWLAGEIENLNPEMRERIWVESFVSSELPDLFKQADVVVSRAGGTIWELAATRKATVLVPLSSAAQDHQRANARVLEEAGAAVIFDEVSSNSEEIGQAVSSLIKNVDARTSLSNAIGGFGHEDAAREIAKLLLFQ